MTEQVVLITGASTGFGRGLAETLPEAGHRPIASMREVDGKNAEHAEALKSAGVDVVEIDVTDDASVAGGVAAALDVAERIDVVVNNAGFGVYGPLEAASVEDLKRQFETNVFGVHRVVRAVLPSMREASSGLLVHVSSGAGRFAFPNAGPYCVSKWALEAMGEVLRYELAPLGVDSVVVEPGPFRTDFASSVQRVSGKELFETYGHLAEAARNRRDAVTFGEPEEVVRAIIDVIDTPRGERPTRVAVHPPLQDELDRLNGVASEVTRTALEPFGVDDLWANGV